MGLLNTLMYGVHAEYIKRALIGGFTYSKIRSPELRQEIIKSALRIIIEGSPFQKSHEQARNDFYSSPSIVQAGFITNSMISLGINHGIMGFHWDYIRNPYSLTTYSRLAYDTAVKVIKHDYGIDVSDSFVP